jgi:hypothetical protein
MHFANYRQWLYSEVVQGQLWLRSLPQQGIYEGAKERCITEEIFEEIKMHDSMMAVEREGLLQMVKERYPRALAVLAYEHSFSVEASVYLISLNSFLNRQLTFSEAATPTGV